VKTEKICDGVWRFKGSSCTYLLRRGGDWVMIDAGDFCECDELRAAVEKVVSLDEVCYVLLTHLHYDHVGCVGLFPNARIFANAVEIEDYFTDAERFHYFAGVEQDEILRKGLEPFSKNKEFLGLEVLRVPGHTRGCVAFLDRGRELLFSGDTIFSGEIIGRTDLPSSLPEQMSWSVEVLRKLERDGFRVLAGHGY